MKVVGRQRLDDFCLIQANAKSRLLAWLAEVEDAEWRTPHEVKRRYASASVLKNNRVVFNIAGNRYRVDVKIDYLHQLVIIVRVGTHEDYDSWKF